MALCVELCDPVATFNLSFATFAALRLYQGSETTATVVARTTFGDGGGGTFAVKTGDTAPDDGALIIVDNLGRRWWRVYSGNASARWWGATGDGVTDDTAALRNFFGANGPKSGFLPAGTYRVGRYLRFSGAGREIQGPPDASIKMDHTLTISGGVYRIQPVLLCDATTDSSVLRGFTLDHRGQDFPLYPASTFTDEIFGGLAGDAIGCALLQMGDKVLLDGLNVHNGWDNCIGVGRFDEETGQQSAAPDQPRVVNCKTFGGGVGKHAWGFAPNGEYHQGCGVNFLTATAFVCSGCTDYGSYNGFWADINGGASGTFTGCIAKNTLVGPIWSDSAEGGNQPWNTAGFGNTITGAGTGWLKMPGGSAFYSGSYGVNFLNCVADTPGLYGFVTDYYSSKNILVGCRVKNSGASSYVFCGKGHKATNLVAEGACQSNGITSPSGSTFPAQPAILITGMAGADPAVEINSTVEITGLIVSKGQVYPVTSLPAAKYNHAVYARTRDGEGCEAFILGGANDIEAGTIGKFGVDSGSKLIALTSVSGQWTINTYGDNAILNVQQGNNGAVQVLQDSSGNASVVNYGRDKVLTLVQTRTGGNDKGIMIWSESVRLLNPPASASGLFSGDLWVDAGASNVVKAVP